MGFFTGMFSTASTNFSPLLIPSRYIPRTLVLGSSEMDLMRSASSTSALLPKVTKLARPMPLW